MRKGRERPGESAGRCPAGLTGTLETTTTDSPLTSSVQATSRTFAPVNSGFATADQRTLGKDAVPLAERDWVPSQESLNTR